jgi:putative membrane protein
MAGGAAVALAIALTALTGGRLTSYTGAAEAATTDPADWWTLWALPPVELAAIALLGVAVAAAVRAAGLPLAGRRAAYLATGLGILVVSVCSPLAGLAQGGVLAAHMMQHTLIGAFAPLPVLLALPRAMPGAPAPGGVLGLLRAASRPVPAFALWAGSTVVWLVPDIHHAVLESATLWVLQQVAFFAFGLLLWMPVLERGWESPRWFGTGAKCGYMVGVWFTGLGIANLYWFSGTAFYESHAVAARAWDLNPLQDQANAGTVMMVTHCFLALGAICVLFFRNAREDGLAQRLRDSGLDADEVDLALRRGELDDMARAAGIPVHTRAGID